ncbi:MAG: metal ABC transporter solute-binding protein, Zn/Mn family [Planctomycetota bacterium]
MRNGTGVTFILAVAVLAAAGAGCGGEPEAPRLEAASVRAFGTILPQQYFIERVGGEHVRADVLVEPGQNPHTFEPGPQKMSRLARADVYFLVGVPFEDVIRDRLRATTPDMRMVDTGKDIKLRSMDSHLRGETPSGHTAEGKDPHVWLDPNNVKKMARRIADALAAIDPSHEPDYRSNLEAFERDLEELDAQIRQICGDLPKRQFMAFHPAFGYFADAYDLQQVAVEVEGKRPSAKDLVHLIERARKNGIKVVFVQKQFSREQAQMIAHEIGGKVVAVDPLAGDYLQNMRRMARAFAEAMR